jgi:CHAT domain-containing protein/Tfp pilus assembly protein PilF
MFMKASHSTIIFLGATSLFLASGSVQASSEDVQEAQTLAQRGEQLHHEGRYADAEPLIKRSLELYEKELGPEHPNVATSLSNLASLYRSQGRYIDAELLIKRSQEIFEKALGSDHPVVGNALRGLALIYVDQGRYADAEPLLKRSLNIYQKAFGPDHPKISYPLSSLAMLYDRQGRLADAETLYLRSLTISEKSLGPDHQEVARLLNNLGALYNHQGRYADAEPPLKRSLAILERALGRSHPDVVNPLNQLALVYTNQGRYADAEPLHRRVLMISEKSLGPNHPNVAACLKNLSELYIQQGRYGDAEPLVKRSLAISEKTFGRNHPNVASVLALLAALYQHMGLYAEAEPLLRRSLAINEKTLGPGHLGVALSLNALAVQYGDQGRYAEAEPLLRRSLAINEKALGPGHPDVATALNNLGALYDIEGRFADAEPIIKRALAIREKALGPNHPYVASSLQSLGALYYSQDRLADAESLYQRSLSIRENALGPNHPNVAASLHNLAVLYSKQGRYAEAEPLLRRSLAINEKALGPNHSDVASSLNNLAEFYNHQGRYAEALPFVRRTIGNRTSTRESALKSLEGARESGLISSEQAFADSYDVLQFTSTSAAAEAIIKLAQRYAAGTDELAMLVRKDQDLSLESKNLDKTLIAAVSRMPSERNQIAEDRIRERLVEIELERKQLTEQLASRFPNYIALAKPQPLSLTETQRLLVDDEALVAFSIDDQSYAWVVTKTESYWLKLPTSRNAINEQVSSLRQSLTLASEKPFDLKLAHKIYESTFGHVAAKITGKKRVSIVANGALTSLPLGLLVASDSTGKKLKDADWLIKSYAITVLPSIYSLKTMRTRASKSNGTRPIIAFADPVFTKKTPAAGEQTIAMRNLTSYYQGTQLDMRSLRASLTPLPGTREEVEAIGKNLNASPEDLKFGAAATEMAVKASSLYQYRVVYFATHGLVAGDLAKFGKAKAEPSLVLSIPDKPSEKDDGLLQASEISQLKLNADWAVLSACNTASGEGVGAEALSGLARAFLYAGARSLVVSHWDVSDEATTTLMSDLFAISASKANISHGEAMREAILNLIDAAKSEQDAHPRIWAPFVVVGEPAKM